MSDRAELRAASKHLRRGFVREHDRGHAPRLAVLTEPRQDTVSIEAWQVNVEQQQVRRVAPCLLKTAPAVAGDPQGVAGPTKRPRVHLSRRSIVFHQEDAEGLRRFVHARKGSYVRTDSRYCRLPDACPCRRRAAGRRSPPRWGVTSGPVTPLGGAGAQAGGKGQ